MPPITAPLKVPIPPSTIKVSSVMDNVSGNVEGLTVALRIV